MVNLWPIFWGFIAILVAIAVLIRLFFTIVVVQGQSMYPILKHGDRVLVLNRWPVSWLKISQIITFYPPAAYPNSSNYQAKPIYVKEVIGLPGDTVNIAASEVSGKLAARISTERDENGNYTWFVPSAHCFVRGTAPMSGDSVIWGPIPINSLIGIVILKLPSRNTSH